mmetsp:Transcript_19678/g.35101  ORF Transcript_19678/g.35101 Transcript_19678/m.35101 type:complete len:224 (-) Transcript_19678:351-1022(-)
MIFRNSCRPCRDFGPLNRTSSFGISSRNNPPRQTWEGKMLRKLRRWGIAFWTKGCSLSTDWVSIICSSVLRSPFPASILSTMSGTASWIAMTTFLSERNSRNDSATSFFNCSSFSLPLFLWHLRFFLSVCASPWGWSGSASTLKDDPPHLAEEHAFAEEEHMLAEEQALVLFLPVARDSFDEHAPWNIPDFGDLCFEFLCLSSMRSFKVRPSDSMRENASRSS